MRAIAILLAAGRGERMGAIEPKAFLQLRGITLLERAVRTVEESPGIDGFLVAAPADAEDRVRELVRSPKLVGVLAGGETRQESVRRALAAVPEGFDVVVCHDVARPLARPVLFAEVMRPLREGWSDGAVPVVPIVDSVKRLPEPGRMTSVPRDDLYVAQTPQAFRLGILRAAHEWIAENGISASDDAEALERSEGSLAEPVPGDPSNIKITRPEDLEVAEALLGADD